MMEGHVPCYPHLNNSCMKTTRPHFESVLIYILLSFITLLTASQNLLVIISISYFKQLHTPNNFLTRSLAVSDFFVSFMMFFKTFDTEGCWIFGDLMCVVYFTLDLITTSASVGTMVLMSIDRYMAICDPLHYPTKVTKKKAQICICLCWICSLLCPSVVMLDSLEHPGRYTSCSGECVFVLKFIERLVDLIFTFIIPITIIVVLYIRVFVVAVSQARVLQSHIADVTAKSSKPLTAKRSEIKAARTLGGVIVVFLICLCPYFCVSLIGQDHLVSTSRLTFVTWLFYFNSCLNPIIYAFFYPWLRKAIKLIVTFKILQTDSYRVF